MVSQTPTTSQPSIPPHLPATLANQPPSDDSDISDSNSDDIDQLADITSLLMTDPTAPFASNSALLVLQALLLLQAL